MKSILFVIPSLGGGGAEKVLVNLVNNLDKTKYNVEILSLFDVVTNLKFLNRNIHFRSRFGRQFRGNRIFFKLFSPKFLYRWIIGRRYDIVVSYLEGPAERIVSGCPYSDSKLVNWIHGEQHTLQNATSSYRSEREAISSLNTFNRTICVADTVKKDYTNLFELNHPCDVLYNTVDSDFIIKSSKESVSEIPFSQGVNVMSVGRLIDVKGYDRLISVHHRLIREGYSHHLYIIGEGDLRVKLQAEIDNLGCSDTVHLLGYHSNPYKILSHADLFVCSSRREGFSTAVTEALILGIPVVSTNCSGAKELLGENNEYGIVTDNSEEGIYEGMKRMLADTMLLHHYKEMADIRSKFFHKDATVAKVEAMFDSL